jgi:hypothetical protein
MSEALWFGYGISTGIIVTLCAFVAAIKIIVKRRDGD